MASFPDVWNKCQRWCRLVILLQQGGLSVCKNIMSEMGIKDITDGAEIYRKMKPFEEQIKAMGFYQQKTLLPDGEVIDTSLMDISLSTYIIQVLDKLQKYPQIIELRYKRTELFFMSEEERSMTEKEFSDYWDKISELLNGLHYNMSLIKGLKTEDHLSQEHQKTLKDITHKIKGSIGSVYFLSLSLYFLMMSIQNSCQFTKLACPKWLY